MVRWTPNWTGFLAEAGNEPGTHKGDVTIVLDGMVENMTHVTCPSGALTVAAEAGTIHGLMVELASGRRLFLARPTVRAIIDAAPGAERTA